MKKLYKPFLFALACLPIALAGGFFVLNYQLELLAPDMIRQMIAQVGSKALLMVVGLIQTAGFVILAAFFGRILAEKLGLWKPLRFEKKPAQTALLLSVLAGILFAADYWTFGTADPRIREATRVGMTLWGILASVFYGGIIEELLLRLFVLSLVAFLL